MSKGLLISIEGPDGAGNYSFGGTFTSRLREALSSQSRDDT